MYKYKTLVKYLLYRLGGGGACLEGPPLQQLLEHDLWKSNAQGGAVGKGLAQEVARKAELRRQLVPEGQRRVEPEARGPPARILKFKTTNVQDVMLKMH